MMAASKKRKPARYRRLVSRVPSLLSSAELKRLNDEILACKRPVRELFQSYMAGRGLSERAFYRYADRVTSGVGPRAWNVDGSAGFSELFDEIQKLRNEVRGLAIHLGALREGETKIRSKQKSAAVKAVATDSGDSP
jgi:hypothetical protein